jgi:hypothetical protein
MTSREARQLLAAKQLASQVGMGNEGMKFQNFKFLRKLVSKFPALENLENAKATHRGPQFSPWSVIRGLIGGGPYHQGAPSLKSCA